MKRLIIELCCAIALVACGNSQESKAGEEDLRAKSLLQGIWIEAVSYTHLTLPTNREV